MLSPSKRSVLDRWAGSLFRSSRPSPLIAPARLQENTPRRDETFSGPGIPPLSDSPSRSVDVPLLTFFSRLLVSAREPRMNIRLSSRLSDFSFFFSTTGRVPFLKIVCLSVIAQSYGRASIFATPFIDFLCAPGVNRHTARG